MRKDYEDKPVVFIAVNSGTSKSDVEGYAKGNKFEWPIVVDRDRLIEKAYGVGTISLQNIYQWVVIDPEGRPRRGEPKALIDSLLPSAKMFFDGLEIPAPLKPVAREMELGIFDPGASTVAALAAGTNKALKDVAAAMFEKLKPVAEGGLEKGKALQAEGKNFLAYREFEKVALAFKKTDYEKTAVAAMTELKKGKDVKDELAAQQMLAQAKQLLSTGKKADQDGAKQILAAIEKKYPGSETAKEAAKLK